MRVIQKVKLSPIRLSETFKETANDRMESGEFSLINRNPPRRIHARRLSPPLCMMLQADGRGLHCQDLLPAASMLPADQLAWVCGGKVFHLVSAASVARRVRHYD